MQHVLNRMRRCHPIWQFAVVQMTGRGEREGGKRGGGGVFCGPTSSVEVGEGIHRIVSHLVEIKL